MHAELPEAFTEKIVARALEEDIGLGDVTTLATVPADRQCKAEVLARQAGVVAGLPVMEIVFTSVDSEVHYDALVEDGTHVIAGEAVASLAGDARSVLTAERTALNFLQRLSGIATLTAQYVAAVEGTKAVILDTRKTTPGLRLLEKYAVEVGGGRNHRFGLFDGILIKDNHLAAAGGITPAIRAARASAPHLLKVEVEVTTLQELEEALAAAAEIVMLDNMTPAQAKKAIELIAGRAQVEISGDVNLDNVRAYAECGPDFISVGKLTHSAPAMNFSLEFS